MDKVIISKAKVKDIEKLISLNLILTDYHNKLDGYKSYKSLGEFKKHYFKFFKKCIYSSKDLLLVARINDEIIGYIYGLIQKKPTYFIRKQDGFIAQSFVKEKYRRLGVTKLLVQKLFSWFKSKNISHVELGVYMNNLTGRKTWQKLGFKEYAYKCRRKI